MSWRSRSLAETRALGAGLAESLPPEGLVVALCGPLGAGKTAFVKGVALALGVDEAALASPTFVIASELPTAAGLRLVHADFYRVEDEAELEAAGLLDWLATGTVLLIEWADRFPASLPDDRLTLWLARGDAPEERSLRADAGGPVAAEALRRWRARCPGSS